MSLINNIATFTGLSKSELLKIIDKSPTNYRRYSIKKKSGGTRLIFHPALESKIIQYAIIEIILKHLPINNNVAFAYVPKKSNPLLFNARAHVCNQYLLHLDFRDFFPSIVPEDLLGIIHEEKKEFSNEDFQILEKSLFIKFQGQQFLSIGAPASPIISNIVMKHFDDTLLKICKKIDDNARYTRYADDLILSSNTKGFCEKIFLETKNLIENIRSPSLTLNTEKTVFSSKKGRRFVTGLCLTCNNQVVIPRNKKREIRSKIHQYLQGKITEKKELHSLVGSINFIKNIEPQYFNKLVIKYGEGLCNIHIPKP